MMVGKCFRLGVRLKNDPQIGLGSVVSVLVGGGWMEDFGGGF